MGDHYNPYEDKTLQYTHPEEPEEPIATKQGFNDVINYFDIINGHQVPKEGEAVPKKFKFLFRVIVIGALAWILYTAIAQLISVIFLN